ncbi:hypothetical protein KIH74_12405 [Kineosporia sp. J2-2]|uniref:Integral membrane protein n=1 Tax=Kineosporia corallincola TaxID=2835133 RepID=A0ABS5TF86_9ACTN|nr:hypothetical protein [Kineosporia corallincola]MBT0769731.1 hypothetical protein [Kineosporia corallincola]
MTPPSPQHQVPQPSPVRATGSDPYVPWPVRVLAVVLVLPFRLAWELLALAGRVLVDFVLVPLARLFEMLIVRPLRFLWRYLVVLPLGWVWNRLLRPLLRFFWRYLLVIPLTWLADQISRVVRWFGRMIMAVLRATAPFWKLLGRLFLVFVVDPLVWLLRCLHRYVLRPGWEGAGWVLHQLYRWTLRPLGRALGLALGWLWRHTVVPLARAAAWFWRHTVVAAVHAAGRVCRWTWQHTVAPVGRAVAASGRWVNKSLLRPARATVRAVLGLRP